MSNKRIQPSLPQRMQHALGSTVLAASMLVLGATQAMAQPAPPPPPEQPAPMAGQPQAPHHGRRMSPEQRQQRMARHQAELKKKLQLTGEQEGAWKAFTDAMQPQPHARMDREDLGKLSTPERIDRMRALRSQRAAEMDRRGDAVKAFYAVLTPAQQKTFDAEAMRMHGARGHGHGDRGMQHQHHKAQ